jgi:Undecaprenyl-phosphate galactose phosphotransferase WbaP
LNPVSVLQPLPFRERRFVPWILALADTSSIQVIFALSADARAAMAPLRPGALAEGAGRQLGLALLLVPLAYWLAGLYPGYGMAAVERLRRRVLASAAVFGGMAVWDNFAFHGEWSQGLLIVAFLATTVLSPVIHSAMIGVLIRADLWGAPVVVLSSADAGTKIAQTLRRRRELGLRPIALFKLRAETWGSEIDGTPVLGAPALAARFADRARIAIVAMPSLESGALMRLVAGLPFSHVVLAPEWAGIQSLWVTARDLGGSLGLDLRKNLLRKSNYYLKRLIDYAFGLPLFLLAAPLIGILALSIKRLSPGPAFYKQEREGRFGKSIWVWKLRTMYPNAEEMLQSYLDENPAERLEWERFFKLKHDPRILPGVGRLLRRTSLDELPQLWNVLRGELSLVGPRPFPKYHVASFQHDFRELRRSVFPGVTGYWQVSARSDGDLTVQECLDTYYLRNWSIWLDIYILARTLSVIVRGDGAY